MIATKPLKTALLMVGLIGGFYLLACPLMHLFHGHGGRRGHGEQATPPDSHKE
jgi:hypothetical protein